MPADEVAGREAGAAFLTLIFDCEGVTPKLKESELVRGVALDDDAKDDAPFAAFKEEAGAAESVECVSEDDICLPIEAIAQPARAPAAPVAELTSPAWLPLAAEVVVAGP
jgi:hypothetical protein